MLKLQHSCVEVRDSTYDNERHGTHRVPIRGEITAFCAQFFRQDRHISNSPHVLFLYTLLNFNKKCKVCGPYVVTLLLNRTSVLE